MIEQTYFYVFAAAAVLCALGVLASRHPINGAMNLVGVMVALAGIFAIQASPFLATLQILVYAGAIMMLVIFVIMVLNSAKDSSTPGWDPKGILSAFPAVVVGTVVAKAVLQWNATEGRILESILSMQPAQRGTVESISKVLFGGEKTTGWAILFLGTGLLLLTAIVGAVLLAKRRLDPPADSTNASNHGGHG